MTSDQWRTWLEEVTQTIAADAHDTYLTMTFEGWDAADAKDAYREWWQQLVDAAIDQGWQR